MFFSKYLPYQKYSTLLLLLLSSIVLFYGTCTLDTVVKESGNTVYRIIADECIGCKDCIEPCPVNAISYFVSVPDTIVVIDPEKCINCGECAAACSARDFPFGIAVEKIPYNQ